MGTFRLRGYREVWLVDTEYNWRPSSEYQWPADPQSDASLPHPVALVARELYTGRTVEFFEGEFPSAPPFDLGPETLFVAYNAAAEWLTFLQLGWDLPCRAIDLYYEYRRHVCGVVEWDNPATNKKLPTALYHAGVLGALEWAQASADKSENIELILRGGPWTAAERDRIMAYCASDVGPMADLLDHLLHAECNGLPALRSDPAGVAQAVHRGHYSFAVARMTYHAIPLDVELLRLVVDNWERIRLAFIAELDTFGVYVDRSFGNKRFDDVLARLGIDDWPRTAKAGLPELERQTFDRMSTRYPELRSLYDLRQQLAELRLENLDVGADGRNRSPLFPFGTKTGRHAPSTAGFILNLPHWTRGFIKPPPGWALRQADYKSQEYHIAAELSGDRALKRIAAAGDPYTEAGRVLGLVLPRWILKKLMLAWSYGGGAELFASWAKLPLPQAESILDKLRRTLDVYTRWSRFLIPADARGNRYLQTVFGWRQCMDDAKITSIRNFPMQANGAEMARLAVCFAVERGVVVVAPLHDSLWFMAPADDADEASRVVVDAMERASREVLDGVTVPVDLGEAVCWPDRYRPEEGIETWHKVMDLLGVVDDLAS